MKTISRFTYQGLRGCHSCGSTDVHAVCHHCGRPLCRQHVAVSKGKEPTIEFFGLRTDLNDPANFPAPIHCEACAHMVFRPNSTLLILGACVAGVGCLISMVRPMIGLPVALAGVGLAAFGWHRKRAAQAEYERRRPPFPVSGVTTEVSGSTRHEGYFEIGADGAVTSRLSTQDEDLRLHVRINEDECARIRGELKAEATEIPVHAGFLLPVAGSQLRMGEVVAGRGSGDGAIPLRLNLSAERLFNSAEDRVAMRLELPLASRAVAASQGVERCLAVVAGITPGSHQSSLELHFLTDIRHGLGDAGEVESLDSIEIDVPSCWGRLVAVSAEHSTTSEGTRTIDGMSEPCRTVRIQSLHMNQRGRPSAISLRFANSIQSGQWVSGRLLATLRSSRDGQPGGATVAGGTFQPWGAARDVTPLNITSRLHLEFRISTSPFRYQSIRVKPDPAGGRGVGIETETVEEGGPMRFPGVVPSHDTVIQFSRTLAATPDLYLRTLAESAPESGAAKGERVRRWKLAGRGYRGLVPIDFEVLLRGSDQSSGAAESHTIVEVSVRGVHNSPELRDEIDSLWRLLRRQATATFGRPLPA